jgi:G3E family GTPase
VYFAQRPFHPQRLLDTALSQSWQGVLRTKGFYWLATRHDVMGLWQSAGGAWQGEPRWVHALYAVVDYANACAGEFLHGGRPLSVPVDLLVCTEACMKQRCRKAGRGYCAQRASTGWRRGMVFMGLWQSAGGAWQGEPRWVHLLYAVWTV